MYTDANLDLLLVGSNLEGLHVFQDVQGHERDLFGVLLSVADGKTAHHHVRVTDRFNLRKKILIVMSFRF